MRLLLVEDDEFFAQRINEYLADNELETTTVGTAQDALATSLDDCSGAVIDVMLPNVPSLSGITVEEARGGYLAGVAVARRLRQAKQELRSFSCRQTSREGKHNVGQERTTSPSSSNTRDVLDWCRLLQQPGY